MTLSEVDSKLQEYYEKERVSLSDAIHRLDLIEKRIARLLIEKDSLVERIIGDFHHNHEGQKSYNWEAYKVEIKTPYNYTVDKVKYLSGEFNLPSEFNPIRERITYEVNKTILNGVINTAPSSVISTLSELITKKPGKPTVNIKNRD